MESIIEVDEPWVESIIEVDELWVKEDFGSLILMEV